MKTQKGITLTSLVIYITIVLIVIGILAVITANLQGNIKEIYAEGTNNSEIDKFNVYFLKEVKKQENEIDTISENEILFTTGNKYTFKSNDKCIYLNNNIKIAENIESCKFSSDVVNEKTVIKVTIKAVNGKEKEIEYVLSNKYLINISEAEGDYTNYIPIDWDVSKLNSETPAYVEIESDKIYVVPIPKGFEISGAVAESTVENGVVIYEMTEEEKAEINWTDSEEVENAKQTYNQFVWIPYTSDVDYEEDNLGPLTEIDKYSESAIDSQGTLDYYYGTNYYNYSDFNYVEDKTNIEKSINKYNGFYVGRYETSIHENGTIGSKKNSEVLTAYHTFNGVYYRWFGLYKVQKDLYSQDEEVFSTMITNKQWNTIMTFTGYGNTIRILSTYTNTDIPDLSGSKYKNTTNTYDVSKNIYDLAGNVYEWTLMASDIKARQYRGGSFKGQTAASFSVNLNPRYIDSSMITVGSRVSLYLK